MLHRYHHLIATGFGSGLFPFAPGTAGSLVASAILITTFLVGHLTLPLLLIATTVVVVHGLISTKSVLLSGRYERKDPKQVVIDEFAGVFVASLSFEFSLIQLAVAFLLFRVFDILKPWPVSKAENYPNEIGVMADDMVAGVIALALTNLLFLTIL